MRKNKQMVMNNKKRISLSYKNGKNILFSQKWQKISISVMYVIAYPVLQFNIIML